MNHIDFNELFTKVSEQNTAIKIKRHFYLI